MSIKSILVPLDGSDESIAVLDTALIIARRFDARIKVIHVKPRTEGNLPYMLQSLPARLKKSVIAEADKKNDEQAGLIKRRFEAFCKKNKVEIVDGADGDGVVAMWHEETGSTVEVLIKHARVADAIATFRPRVTSSRLRRSPAGENLEAIMMRAGRPIVLVPPKWSPHKVSHAALAWNESLEATRAMAMTMPWLSQMKRVTLIVSRKRKENVPEVLQYLSLHGVKAKVKYLSANIKSVGQGILDVCTDNEVEFLVMGGFSRARSRQLVLGGVTHHLLAKANVITVMVH